MGRKRQIIPYSLNSGEIKKLPENEIKAILRAADELIATGGRNMLVKILKGSKDKKVLEHKLDQCPVYGFYHELTMEKISERVDWVIKEDYLRIRYSGRLPVLVFSDRGWEIERETYAEEIFEKFYRDAHDNKTDAALEMAQVNRQVVFDVLEKIRASRDVRFLPILEAWKAIEVRKVRARINNVERTLMSDEEGPVMEKS